MMAIITALSWAVLAIALKFALQTFSSGTIVWVRLLLAFLILLFYAFWRRPGWLSILKRPPLMALSAGVLIAINYYGYMKGVEFTGASNAQIMIQLAPMSFVLLSVLWLKEKPSPHQTLGLLTAVMGFGFFYWDQFLVSWENLAEFQVGNIWLIIAALTWAVFAIFQKKSLKKYAPQQFNLLIYATASVLLAPLVTWSEASQLNFGNMLLLAFLAINTVVAYGALSEALIRIPSSEVSVIISSNPLVTLLLMTILTQMEVQWIRGEPIYWRGFLGAVLVVLGVIFTVKGPPRLSRKKH